MASFRITYERSDIKGKCVAWKFADNEKIALNLLTTSMKKKNIPPPKNVVIEKK